MDNLTPHWFYGASGGKLRNGHVAEPPDDFQSSPNPAQVTPPFRWLGEIDIAQMIFELQGSFGEVKEGLRTVRQDLSYHSKKLEALANLDADLTSRLFQLAPKIDDVAGFLKHRAPPCCQADLELFPFALAQEESSGILFREHLHSFR